MRIIVFRSVWRISDSVDHGNHNKDQMDDTDNGQNLKPEARSNNGDVLPHNKFRQVLEP